MEIVNGIEVYGNKGRNRRNTLTIADSHKFFDWWATYTKRPWDSMNTADLILKSAFEAGQKAGR